MHKFAHQIHGKAHLLWSASVLFKCVFCFRRLEWNELWLDMIGICRHLIHFSWYAKAWKSVHELIAPRVREICSRRQRRWQRRHVAWQIICISMRRTSFYLLLQLCNFRLLLFTSSMSTNYENRNPTNESFGDRNASPKKFALEMISHNVPCENWCQQQLVKCSSVASQDFH